MSAKHSITTADYLPWDTAISLVRELYKDNNFRMSLLLGCGFFFGLRISDLLALKWNQILNVDELTIIENKTRKKRIIRVNSGFQGHIHNCHDALNINDDSQHCFLNRFGSVISIQMVNRHFKEIKVKYRLPIKNFSTHSMRKTASRTIWENENAKGRGSEALVILSEILNHNSVAITSRYLGLRQEEKVRIFESLIF